ncbi:MAG: ABC transporter substrate-binding protein [Oscillospiraceae bacterium]|jgi:peptide/nickel transport system substrate-binding protein|nr:ABC transporter substrate-binding protein [Oscillospiraceae bacterium]
MKNNLASRILSATLAILLLALTVAGCAADKPSGTASDAGTASAAPEATNGTRAVPDETADPAPIDAKGGNLVFALATTPDHLDPHRAGLAVSTRVTNALFDSLVALDENGGFVPYLAKSWEVSDDYSVYTFKLRDDVKFHDGTPFNAEAVVFNFERLYNPETQATGNITSLFSGFLSGEALDEFTVQLNFSVGSPSFLTNLARFAFVSPAASDKYGDQFTRNPVGTGAFRFVSYDEDIKLERNPDYNWAPEIRGHQGPAYLETLTYKIVAEEATRVGSVESREVSAAETVPPQNVLSLRATPGLQVLEKLTLGLPYTLFYNFDKPIWNNLNVRKAIRAGVDIGTIVQTLYLGTYPRAWSIISPGLSGYDASLENKDHYDPEAAKALLEAEGWLVGADGYREKDGERLKLHYFDNSPNREKRNDIAVMVREQLKEIGVEVEVEISTDGYNQLVSIRGFDVMGNSFLSGDLVSSLRGNFYYTEGGFSIAHLNDPKVNAWIDQVASEFDPAKAEVIYKEIQQYFDENALTLPIYVFPYTVAAIEEVTDLNFDFLGYPVFYDTYIK